MDNEGLDGSAAGTPDDGQEFYTKEEQDLLRRAGEACISAAGDIIEKREDLAHIVFGSLVGVVAFASDDPDRVLREAFTVAYNAGKGNYFSDDEKARLSADLAMIKADAKEGNSSDV